MHETLDFSLIMGGAAASPTAGAGAATAAETSRETRSAVENMRKIMRETIMPVKTRNRTEGTSQEVRIVEKLSTWP